MDRRLLAGIFAAIAIAAGVSMFALSTEDPAATTSSTSTTEVSVVDTALPPLATSPETTVFPDPTVITLPGETTTTQGYAILLPNTKFATIPRYHNCDEVKAAGKAPLYSNQPGYRPDLDPDHDGIACDS